MLVNVQNHGLRKVLAMPKSSGLILQLTEGIGLGGGLNCVKNFFAAMELWVDDEFEMSAFEVK